MFSHFNIQYFDNRQEIVVNIIIEMLILLLINF